MASAASILVVDDETSVQRLVAGALRQIGYHCMVASNGEQAEEIIAKTDVAAVISDLKMPVLNGHALAIKLLNVAHRPLVVIYTGVVEPKLALDLLKRGVDDIIFKPLSPAVLAAKVHSLVERSHARGNRLILQSVATDSRTDTYDDADEMPVGLERLNRMLREFAGTLPLSPATQEVYEMTRSGDCTTLDIAKAIQRDPSLTAQLLKLSNSALYNSSNQPISHVETAVVLIGHKRIGEMSLASMAISMLTRSQLPWLDVGLAWKRSMAAGIALELLVDRGEHQSIADGLFLSDIMHPLGRIALGIMFPAIYERMIRECEERTDSLDDRERCGFPTSHSEVLAYLLDNWGIPREVYLPVKYSADDFASLIRLPEPTRMRAEIVKTAISIGQFAIGQWEDWELIQLPGNSLLQRLRIDSIKEIIDLTKANVQKISGVASESGQSSRRMRHTTAPVPIAYSRLANDPLDFLPSLLESIGLAPFQCTTSDFCDSECPIIVNCMDTIPTEFSTYNGSDNVILIADANGRWDFDRLEKAVTLPSSYRQFRLSILDALLSKAGA